VRNFGSIGAETEVAAINESGVLAQVLTSLPAGGERLLTWRLPNQPLRTVVDPDVRVLQLNRDRAALDL